MKLSVIGAGNMGRAITSALLAAGHDVTIYNRTRAKAEALAGRGARIAPDAAEAIRASDYTIVILLDADSTRAVLDAAETRAALSGKALISGAQMDAGSVISLAQSVGAAGGRLSDFVVTTYPDQVEARTTSYCIACHPQDTVAWMQIFGTVAKSVWDVGAVGQAQNLQNAAWLSYLFMTVAIGSALAAFERLGLPVHVLKALLRESPTLAIAGSEEIITEMSSRQYGSDKWTVDNMVAALDQVLPFAHNLKIDTSVIQTVRELYAKASRMGFGNRDITALYEAINTPV